MEKTIVNIKGMHCRSCEILIEDELSKVPGVDHAKVNHSKGIAEIYHNNGLDEGKVSQAICSAGYNIGKEDKIFISKDPNDYLDLLAAIGILGFVYLLATNLGIFDLINSSSGNFASLPVVFIVGLTAGLSTCMALVGGLVLGASAKFAEKHPMATPLQKFKPHLYFNLGRISSYFVFGGIIGFGGSFFQITPLFLGVLTIAVGLVMLLLGVQLIEIFPVVKKFSFTMPKFIGRILGIKEHHEKEYSHKNSILLGALTFFLPCGFTQAMQIYAISTGDPLKGALTMGIFALGTAPGLLGIGGLTSVVKGAFAKSFFKFAGIIVIVLAFFNISNGYNLTGFTGLDFSSLIKPTISSPFSDSNDSNVLLENNVQVVRMTQHISGYSPNSFTIKKNVPVKWIINSENINSCASTIVSSKIGLRKTLSLGENIVEFTPEETGQIKFSCIMGMYQGVFNVVDEQSSAGDQAEGETPVTQAPADSGPKAGGSCGSGGGGCGCGGGNKQVEESEPAPVNQEGQVQIIKTVYTLDKDIQPNNFKVLAGKPVRMEIDVKESGQGCMSGIMIPGLVGQPEQLIKGKPVVFNFTPDKPGKYNITCAMGVPRGTVTVN